MMYATSFWCFPLLNTTKQSCVHNCSKCTLGRAQGGARRHITGRVCLAHASKRRSEEKPRWETEQDIEGREGKWTRSFRTHPGPEKARHIRVGESFSNFHCKVLNKRPNPTHVLIHGWRRTQARKVQPRVTWAFLLMDDLVLLGIFLP